MAASENHRPERILRNRSCGMMLAAAAGHEHQPVRRIGGRLAGQRCIAITTAARDQEVPWPDEQGQ